MRLRPTVLAAALAAAALPGAARAQAPSQAPAQVPAQMPAREGVQEGVHGPLPSQPDALVAYVTKALHDHDLPALERLVNWSGIRAQRRRLTLYQIRSGFGRPVRQASLEPMPEDGLAEVTARGTLRANMPVTERLRVVFDEPPVEGDAPPTSLFLIGREGATYRIALLVPTGPPRGK